MSKIAIISQPDQGVLIDVSGCSTLKEALEHLSSTLQVSDQFWHGMHVSINLGALAVTADELAKIVALAKGVGIKPVGIYSTNDSTRESLRTSNIPLGSGKPMTLPTVALDSNSIASAEVEDKTVQKSSPFATITMRVVDAMSRRAHKEHATPDPDQLEDMESAHLNENEAPQSQSAFPHIRPKRKVSLDGRPIGANSAEPSERSQPVSKEKLEPKQSLEDTVPPSTDATKEADEIVTAIIEGDCSRSPDKAAADCIDVEATVEAVDNEKPADCPRIDLVAKEPVQAKTKEECNSDNAPGSDVKVMTIQVVDSMIEAQPAQKSIAQASTMADEVITQVDADAQIPASSKSPSSTHDIEDAEDIEFDEEEVEADSVDLETPARGGPTTLYLRQTLRSGQTVSHKGHLVIIGDINPGAEVMADGDITVWGCLRGVAHAGIGGNTNAEIRALKLQPIQIRIAHAIARAPDRPRVSYSQTTGPETARMVDGKIKVVRSRLD
ncbi:MAG: septum site-determining protein MinC [Candidatus Obscuribacterales bacterium]|nr:septum site-determining protein MinC [Candidatus Obscuribacterales bacterium]